MRTELIVPSAAADTASSPSRAPVGTMIWPPLALASSISSGRGSRAPQLRTMTRLPAVSIGRQIASKTAAGAHSTARSACCGRSSRLTKGQVIRCSLSQACALAWSRAATQASVAPGTPWARRRARTRPMAPRPAMAMRMSDMRSPAGTARSYAARRGAASAQLDATGGLPQTSGHNSPTCTEFGMRKLMLGVAMTLLGLAATASAQEFPTRPITMVIPFAAGGPTDVLGRVVAARMSEVLKQNVIVENIGGAGGMTGSARVAQAKPDGYTMVLGTVGTHAQGQTLYKRPLYNAATDFTPVALIAEVPIVLITRKDLPVSNLKEFVAYAKKNQDKMSFGSAGAGSATHLGFVVLNTAMGTKITHVPYRGTGPAMTDLQGGRIDFLCEIMSTAKPQ